MLSRRVALSFFAVFLILTTIDTFAEATAEEGTIAVQVAQSEAERLREVLYGLTSDDSSLRNSALEYLRRLSRGEDFDATLSSVLRRDVELRSRITYAEVMRLIEHGFPAERSADTTMMMRTTDERTISNLRNLYSGDAASRMEALEDLRELSTDEGFYQALVESIGQDEMLRANSVGIMEEIGVRQSNDFIARELLKLPEPEIRREAATALGRIGDRSYVEPLIESLQTDGDDLVRAYAARSLGSLGSNAAVRPLMRAIQNDVLAVRYYAVGSLGSFKSADAVSAATAAMMRDHIYVQYKAAEVLCKIGDRRATIFLNRWLNENFVEPVDIIASTSGDGRDAGFAASIGCPRVGLGAPVLQDEPKSLEEYYFCVEVKSIWLKIESEPSGAEVYLVERYYFEEEDEYSYQNRPDLYRVNSSDTWWAARRMKYYIIFKLDGYRDSKPRLIDADIDPLKDAVCQILVKETLNPAN